ncbi:iron-sulfur cluster assembly protein [Streptomyces sp. Ru73]|uniref:iron-sulfur cluster assembly protein n=1 Tax=Streptomyces sp. Ru73 TaxID=2080748 RepID=UPI0015E483CB|nr:iron-sulfur cluster assembly protein [Streptomyces sp. Ru73]
MTGERHREDAADRVRAAVYAVRDPEIDVTLADLGVLRSLTVRDDAVDLVLAPTRTACPGRAAMEGAVRAAVATVLPAAAVHVVWQPGAWRAEHVTERGLRTLRGCGYGVAGRGPACGEAATVQLRRCPYCGSGVVESLGRFGGSVCRTPFLCRSCGSAFDELGSARDIK